MKKWLLVFAGCILFARPAFSQAPEVKPHSPDGMDLYLLIGQSNMAGRGRIKPEDLETTKNLYTLNKEGEWTLARAPLHFDKPAVVGTGLGKTFGLCMLEKQPSRQIGLIPCAVGGSPIDAWQPGAYYKPTRSYPYDDAIRRAKAAMQSGELKGILWHQGESDCKPGLAEVYEQKLHSLVERLREELDAPLVPFVVGQMGQFDERPWDSWKKQVDQAHRTLPKKISATAFVSSDGLKHKGDVVHFDSASYRELGRRYSAAIQWLQASPRTSAEPKKPMNFLFFLVDDLGWADLGCYGSRFHETPNIDRLCVSGMQFNYGYAACPVCSPTRASILTGRHPVRVDITDWIPGQIPNRTKGAKFQQVKDRDSLGLSEVTLAEILGRQGYQTFFAGKWHLGGEGRLPTDQGFDINIGGGDKGSPPGGYYAPWRNPYLTAKEPGEYLTERLTQESISFLQTRQEERPFFLYMSYYNVHTPITPYQKRVGTFESKAAKWFEDHTPVIKEHQGLTRGRQDNAAYASMIRAVDDSVGQILDTLDQLGLSQNTTVIFFSDNGGLSTKSKIGPTCNLPLRAGKGWLYEGGVRVPTLIRVPGITAIGSRTDIPVVSMDFFPTILDLAELPEQPELHCDGQSLSKLLAGEENANEPRALFWHYPHYHGSTWTPGASIRHGDWKLIEFYHEGKVELYNLPQDPGELAEVGEQFPKKRAELRQKLHDWQGRLGARMPVPFEGSSTSQN